MFAYTCECPPTYCLHQSLQRPAWTKPRRKVVAMLNGRALPDNVPVVDNRSIQFRHLERSHILGLSDLDSDADDSDFEPSAQETSEDDAAEKEAAEVEEDDQDSDVEVVPTTPTTPFKVGPPTSSRSKKSGGRRARAPSEDSPRAAPSRKRGRR